MTLDEGGTIDNVRAGDGADDIALSGKTKTGGTVATLRGDAGDDTYTIDLIETVKEETTTTTTTSENGEGSSGNNETQTPETTPAYGPDLGFRQGRNSGTDRKAEGRKFSDCNGVQSPDREES